MLENNKQIFKTSKMTDVTLENYYIILVLERFGMQLGVRDKTVSEVCNDFKISPKVFITIANLNGTKFYENNYCCPIKPKIRQYSLANPYKCA